MIYHLRSLRWNAIHYIYIVNLPSSLPSKCTFMTCGNPGIHNPSNLGSGWPIGEGGWGHIAWPFGKSVVAPLAGQGSRALWSLRPFGATGTAWHLHLWGKESQLAAVLTVVFTNHIGSGAPWSKHGGSGVINATYKRWRFCLGRWRIVCLRSQSSSSIGSEFQSSHWWPSCIHSKGPIAGGYVAGSKMDRIGY